MGIRRFTYDEAWVIYEDTEGEYEVDIPNDLYQRWLAAIDAMAQAEGEIARLYEAQHPQATPSTRPRPVPAKPTAPAPIPRTLAEYQRATP